MPLSTPWIIQCGPLGLKVVLASNPEADASLRVAWTVSAERCRELSTVAAQTMAAIVSGR